MGKIGDLRKHFISRTKKNRVSKTDFKGKIRYSFDKNQRSYILSKLDKQYWDLAYNYPMPDKEDIIACEEAIYTDDTNLIYEIKWFFEVFGHYHFQLNIFTELNNSLERNLLLGNTSHVDLCINKIQTEVSYSIYLLIVEMYLNEQENNPSDNEVIVKEIAAFGKSSKLPLIAEFSRLRMDKELPTWQYDSTVDHHKSLYSGDAKNLIDYVILKFDPLNLEYNFKDIPLLLNMESEFSVVDRLNSIQEILPLVVNSLSDDEKIELKKEAKQLANESKDLYWNRLICLLDSDSIENIEFSSLQETHDQIADFFFMGEYSKVARIASASLKVNPEIIELQLFFVKSIIYTKEEVSNYFYEDNVLTQILKLLKSVYLKDGKYISNREKLLGKYYNNSFFSFSNCLLCELYSEFQFNIPQTVITKAFLTSKVLSANSIKAFNGNDYIKTPIVNRSKWNSFLRQSFVDDNVSIDFTKFYQVELYVISKMNIENYDLALQCLDKFYRVNNYSELPEFVKTWLTKNRIKCQYELKLFKEAVNLIVEDYFRTNTFYDHYHLHELIDELIENDDSPVYKEIAVPILFHISKQPQSLCYDSIANFLIQHNLYLPSQLEQEITNFDRKYVTYFLEKCCIKSHIEDSPFINSIDALSSERISILNCLKKTNPDKLKKYNEEILNITKEDTIRKGVKHIHESRIFIDTDSLFKILNSEITEIFDRYLSIDNQKYSALPAITLDEVFDPNRVESMFYCLEPVDKSLLQLYLFGEPINNPNIVRVPIIRYTHFVLLYEEIKEQFIFNEDFGFKSFLSMRIRHGTFSNVLRNVFDKYNLISSKETTGDEYDEIIYWKENCRIPLKFQDKIQEIFKKTSRSIDDLIDLGLSWIKIYEHEQDKNAMFDFAFTDFEMKANFINKVGRINNPNEFIKEVFNILYDRLNKQLEKISRRIGSELSPKFVELIEKMEADIAAIYGKSNKTSLVEEQIIACKTEIQLVINQIQKWFKISQNHYVNEFPIEMILETSIDYTNSINGDILRVAKVEKEIQCNSKYKGKYFEGFGDMLINIFDNIIKNNKDLNEKLRIFVKIKSDNGLTKISVSNNLSPKINIQELELKIKDIKRKVNNYKNGNMANSFEGDSGYLKICRCISADLEQTNYEVDVDYSEDKYEVLITIENENLIV